MALNRVEKEVGVTVKVDATGALKAWREYKKATEDAKKSTEDMGKSEAAMRKQITERSRHMAAAARHHAKLEAEAAAARKQATDDFKQRTNDNLMAIGRFTAGMGIAAVAIDKASQRHLQYVNVTKNLKISIDAARESTQGFVTDMDLSRSAAMATSFGVVKTDEDFARLAATAQKLATRLGTDTATAMADLTTAISRQSPMILDNLGITLKVTEAQEMYARELRKSVKDLTEVEKKDAFRFAALKKAEEATKGVTVATEGSASSIQRFKVGLENATDTVLGWGFAVADNQGVRDFASAISGAVGPFVDLGVAIRDAKNEVQDYLPTTVDMGKGLAAVREATGSLVSPTSRLTEGVHALANAYRELVGDDLAKKLQATLDIVNAKAGDLQSLSTFQFQNAERAKAETHELEKQERLHKAIGSNEDDLFRIQQQKFAVLKEEAALRFDMFEVMRLIREEELAMFDSQIRTGGGAKGDRFASQRAAFEAELAGSQRAQGFNAMNRDDQTARGEFDEQLGIAQRNKSIAEAQAQYNAQLEAAEEEHLRKMEDMRKKAHDAEEKRKAEAKRTRDAAIRHQQAIHNVAGALSQQSISLAEEVAVATAGSERQRTLIMQGFQASQATAIGVMETVKAAAAFAALNPVQGAMHTGAAALAFAKAGLLAGGVIGPGAGSSGGGGGGGSSSFGGGGSSGGGSRSASGQSAPISRKGEQHASPAASSGGGGAVTVNFNSYLPADKEKMGMAIREAVKHSGESFGSLD